MSIEPKLYVHGAKFHLDDLLCSAMGKILGYEIERTLDNDICEKIGPKDIVCDFGKRYDGVKFFDHHQSTAPYSQKVGLNTRFPFAKVAAAGLLWAARGADVIKAVDPRVPKECIQEAIDTIDQMLIAPSDKIDTGGDIDIPNGVCTLSSAISACNPISQNLKDSDAEFFKMLPFVVNILKAHIEKVLNTIYGKKTIDNAPILDGKIIVLSKYTPWTTTVVSNQKFDNCLFCVYPSNRGGWNAQVIPNINGKGARKFFPIEWIGCQSNAETAKAMGFNYDHGDNFFCHEGRWIISVPTKDMAIEACRKAML